LQVVNVLVTGSYFSRRTLLIKHLSEIDYVHTELESVPISFGRLTAGESTLLYLLGTPDTRRFEADIYQPILEKSVGAGIVLMVHAARREGMQETHPALQAIRTMALPYVIAVTHSGESGALSESEIRQLLGILETEVMHCFRAFEPEEARVVLLSLLKLMPQTNAVQAMIEKVSGR
jgi:signal recognition particle receptor subunit beta